MDEPCSALDPIATERIEELIHELRSEVTIVIVTHNLQQAKRVSDQTAFFLMDKSHPVGRLIEFGATKQVFDNPKEQSISDYINGILG